MATVAQRRFEDAIALADTNNNARANGVVYLAGFVVEILLKARLIEKFPAIARKPEHEINDKKRIGDDEREIWRLIWKQHSLEGMLERLSELEAFLKKKGERDGQDYVAELKKVFGIWTIQFRYSSQQMSMNEARNFLERVRLLKEQLR